MGTTLPPLSGSQQSPSESSATTTTTTPDPRKQAIDFLADATKQLITVAAGIITATVIFSKDLTIASRYLALAAWVALMLSVLGGLGVLFIITGKLKKFAAGSTEPPEMDNQIGDASKLQWIGFLVGLFLVVMSGFFASPAKPEKPDSKPITVTCIAPTAPPPAIPPPPPAVHQQDSGPTRTSHKKKATKKS